MTTIFDHKAVARLAAHFCPVFHFAPDSERPVNYTHLLQGQSEEAPMLSRGDEGQGTIHFSNCTLGQCCQILDSFSLLVPDAQRQPPRLDRDSVLSVSRPNPPPPLDHVPVVASGWTSGFAEFVDLIYVLSFAPREGGGICEAAVALRLYRDAANRAEVDESGFARQRVSLAEWDSRDERPTLLRWRSQEEEPRVDEQQPQRICLFVHPSNCTFSCTPGTAFAAGALPGTSGEEGLLPPFVLVFNRPIALHDDGVWYRHNPLRFSTRPPYDEDKEDAGDADAEVYFFTGVLHVRQQQDPPRYQQQRLDHVAGIIFRYPTDTPLLTNLHDAPAPAEQKKDPPTMMGPPDSPVVVVGDSDGGGRLAAATVVAVLLTAALLWGLGVYSVASVCGETCSYGAAAAAAAIALVALARLTRA